LRKQGKLYVIDENSQVPIPLLTDYFRGWLGSQPDINSIKDLISYAEKKGLEGIGMELEWADGVVKSDIHRPYVLIINGAMYVGVHILNRILHGGYGAQPVDDEAKILHEIFKQYLNISNKLRIEYMIAGANASYVYDGDWKTDSKDSNFLHEANSLISKDPLPFEIIKEYIGKNNGKNNWGTMLYCIPLEGRWFNKVPEGQRVSGHSPIEHYELTSGKVCWGSPTDDDGYHAYYLDELIGLELGGMKGNNYLNWLNNPLSKNIRNYHEMVSQERKRIADLERRKSVENEFITNMNHDYKKMIRFHNQLKEVITGKCADGLYFNTPKINYLLHKFRSGDLSNSKARNQNMPLSQILQHMQQFNSISNRPNHNSWPKLHIFMKDLFGENYNLKLANDKRSEKFDEIYNWTTWPMIRLMNNMWFQQILISGIDLSYYLIGMESESYKNLYGTMELAEDSLVLKFNKEGGPLDKSKYYSHIKKDIYENLKSKPSGLICVVPKWMLIKYEGGELVEF
jgi:hypothetical protein